MNIPGQADHAAPTSYFWNNAAFRTAVQGIALDLLLALALVVFQATSGDHVDWRLLGLSLLRTALQTLASSVMKRVKPTIAQVRGIGS